MPFVVDASVVATWFLPDEWHPGTEALFDRLEVERAHAPDLLAHEVRNFIIRAYHRKRIGPGDVPALVRRYEQVGIVPAGSGDSRAVLDLAVIHGLTAYDAAYLELAIDRRLPLATLDKALRRAAEAEGVMILPEQR